MQSKFRPNPNSFKNTFCVFHEVNLKKIMGLKPNFESSAGSKYFYSEKGMLRLSNHWGKLANSKWRLIALKPETDSKTKLGFANWNDFYPDNNHEKLYYLDYDSKNQTINYQHKNNPEFDQKPVLRTTIETTKRIKQARNILTLSSWAKYYQSEIEALRIQIINELIFTEKTLDEIKRNLS
jgi:hypothetical protein